MAQAQAQAPKTRKPRKIANPQHWTAQRDRHMAQTARLTDEQCAAARDWLNATFFGA